MPWESIFKVTSYLNENSMTIFILLIIASAVLFHVRSGGNEQLLYKAALFLVSSAEEEWGSNTGKIKFAEVYVQLRKEYPILTAFVSEKTLTELIEEALSEMKRILASKAAVENTESEEVKAE